MNLKIAVLALAALPAFAGARDLRPGTVELSGGTRLDFGSATLEREFAGFSEEVDVSTVALEAEGLYYIANNLGVGLGISYEKDDFDYPDGDSDEISTSLIGPMVKYNIPLAPQFSIALEGGIGRMVESQNDQDIDGFALLLGGGARFFATDWMSLDAMLSYTRASLEDDFDVEYTVSGWDLGVAVSFYLGGR